MTPLKVPVEVSARHVHLSVRHLEILFGKSYKLKLQRRISQPNQFATQEFVSIIGRRGEMAARVIGPVRSETQVELTMTECRQLGIKPILKISGDLQDTSGCILRGPVGIVKLKKGVIVPQRHLHISPAQAAIFKLKHGQIISIKTQGLRAVTWHNVYVRCREGIDKLSFMIDTDEANAAGLKGGEFGLILRK